MNEAEGRVAVITGGGSGIGRALALVLARRGIKVFIIGRTPTTLLETRSHLPELIKPIEADITQPDQWADIAGLLNGRAIGLLIHAAATLGPFGRLTDLDYTAWREVMATNIEAPIFLTQALRVQLKRARVLFIGNGSAEKPLKNLGAYCCTKASLAMARRVFSAELDVNDLAVSALAPGYVDTPMQKSMRSQRIEDFPATQYFSGLAENNQLLSPALVADFMGWLLLDTSTEQYAAVELWDMLNAEHQLHWRTWKTQSLQSNC